MEQTFSFKMTETELQKFDSLIDETILALRRLDEEGVRRDARVDQLRMETGKRLDEVEKRLAEISIIHQQHRSFAEKFDWE